MYFANRCFTGTIIFIQNLISLLFTQFLPCGYCILKSVISTYVSFAFILNTQFSLPATGLLLTEHVLFLNLNQPLVNCHSNPQSCSPSDLHSVHRWLGHSVNNKFASQYGMKPYKMRAADMLCTLHMINVNCNHSDTLHSRLVINHC